MKIDVIVEYTTVETEQTGRETITIDDDYTETVEDLHNTIYDKLYRVHGFARTDITLEIINENDVLEAVKCE